MARKTGVSSREDLEPVKMADYCGSAGIRVVELGRPGKINRPGIFRR